MVGNMRDLCEGEEVEETRQETGKTRGQAKQRQVSTQEAEAYAKQEGWVDNYTLNRYVISIVGVKGLQIFASTASSL